MENSVEMNLPTSLAKCREGWGLGAAPRHSADTLLLFELGGRLSNHRGSMRKPMCGRFNLT